jgi:magnesium transporter
MSTKHVSPTVTAVTWDGAAVRRSDTPAAALESIRAGACTWLDICGRSPEIEKVLGPEGLDLHPLVIEDIFGDRERPKIEDFGRYVYIIVHAPVSKVRKGEEVLALTEMDVILGEHFVVTHHKHPMRAIESVMEDVGRSGRPLKQGAAYVAHGVLDHVVDDYIPVLDRIDAELDALETEVLTGASDEVLAKIFRIKRELQQLRRAVVHQKEVFHRLGRGDFQQIPEALVPFFRDVFDHFARVSDLAESYRDLVGGALETYLSVQSNRMNAIMKTLTLTATLFMPLTFIAGLYGMNFEFMPELRQRWGYPMVLGVMVLMAIGMLIFYRRRGWIGRRHE